MTRFLLVVTLLSAVLMIIMMLWTRPEAATLEHDAGRVPPEPQTCETAWCGVDDDDELGLFSGPECNQDDWAFTAPDTSQADEL